MSEEVRLAISIIALIVSSFSLYYSRRTYRRIMEQRRKVVTDFEIRLNNIKATTGLSTEEILRTKQDILHGIDNAVERIPHNRA